MSAKKINIRIGGKSLGKRKASGHKPYSCDLCGKTFKAKASVRRHMKTHSSVKEFQCEYCSKGFHQKSNLMAHIRLHTGERPFLCNACGGRFSYIAALQRHTRVCGSAAASQAPVYSRIESVSSINSHIEPISQPSHTDSTDVSDTDTQGSVRMNYGSVVRSTAPVSTPPFQSLYPNPTLRVPSAPSTFRGVDFTPARGVSALPSASMSRMSWGANSHDSFAPVNTHLRLPTDEKQGFCVQKLNIGDSRSIYAYMKIEVPPGCATLDGIEPVPTADYAAFMYVPPTVSEIEPTYAPLRRVQSGTWLSPSNQQSVSVGVSAAASALAASSFEPSQPLPELTMGRVSSDPWQFTPAFGTTQ